MKVLLTGARGQLGRELQAQCPPGIKLIALDSSALDITDQASLGSSISSHQPQVILNAAAYTQVDKAEAESDRAHAVNADGVANLVNATDASIRLIHVSTDFVFDGTACTPIPTDAATNPLSAYGSSKLAGESYLLQHAAARSCIVRTAWLYGTGGKNFVDTMLNLMQTRESLRVVADQRGTPTSCKTLAGALWQVVKLPSLTGILHWTDDGETTWHGFACEIQRLGLKYGLLQKKIPVEAIATQQYPTPARRPAYSVLEKETTFAKLGLRAPAWQEALEAIILERCQRERQNQGVLPAL